MKIESIEISNFRQFYSSIKIQFSTDIQKNVTVVHGSNGSGKTSLLNAFKWCFYSTTDFDTANEHILNEAAISNTAINGTIELRICVTFSHLNNRYIVRRSQTFRRIAGAGLRTEKTSDPDFVIDIIDDSGETKRAAKPSVELQNILPSDLHPYFFFNGERIEHIAGVNESGQVRDAIKKLMGLELLDRTIIHVNKAKSSYSKIARREVSEEQSNLIEDIEFAEEEIGRLENLVEQQEKDLQIGARDQNLLERELKRYNGSRELQRKRDELIRGIEQAETDINQHRIEQKEIINTRAFMILSKTLFDHSYEIVEKNRSKGILPYGINKQFIDDRIEMDKCICGRVINTDSEEHKALLLVRDSAGTEEQESAYTSVSALLKTSNTYIDEFHQKRTYLAKKIYEIQNRKSEFEVENDNIGAELTNHNESEIVKLEEKRFSVQKQNQDIRVEIGIAKRDLEEKKKSLKLLRSRRDDLERAQNSVNIAQKRIHKTEFISETLSDLKEALSFQVKEDLSRRVNTTFKSIIRKPVAAKIDDNYSLQVVRLSSDDEIFKVNEQSTGEKQVTSLSFISSIIDFAKEKLNTRNPFIHGGLYPLVMDSPFGSLDDDYREKVAAKASDLAEQVIMFVSNSQWNGKVKQATEDKVGRAYRLVYHSPSVKSAEQDSYRRYSENGYEYSTVEEVQL